ncbi:hypothetical protein B5S33_g727 [[Candida] boidinii]|nr:hypothetical protein B5S33_g727 [[Candida] boidinii]
MSSVSDTNQTLGKNPDIPVESTTTTTTSITSSLDSQAIKENGHNSSVTQPNRSEATATTTTSSSSSPPQTTISKTDKRTTPSKATTTRRRKKKVGMACVYCRRSHMICDEGRPCQRCMKRKIGHLCHDEPASTKTRKKQKKENGSIEGDNNSENSGDEDTEQSAEPEPSSASSIGVTVAETSTTSTNPSTEQKSETPTKMGATFDVKYYNEQDEIPNSQSIKEYSSNFSNQSGAFITEANENTDNVENATQTQPQPQQQPQPQPHTQPQINNNITSNQSQHDNSDKTTGFSNTSSKVHLNQYNNINSNNNNNTNFYNKSATGSIPQSSTSLNQQPFFYSEHAGSEFNSLTEFLSMIDDTDMINSINLNNDPMLAKLENATSSQLGSYNNSATNLHTQFLEQTGMGANNITNNMNGNNNGNMNNNNNGNSRTNNKSNTSNSVLSSMGFTVPSSTNVSQFNNMYKTPNDSTSNFLQPSIPPLQQQQQQQHQNVDQMQPHQQLQRMELPQPSSNNMLIQSPYVGRQQQQQQQQPHQQQQQRLPYDRHSNNNGPPQIQNSNNNSTTNFSSQTSQSHSQSHNQTPVISDAARDKFFLTAADPTTEVSPEERLKQVISAKLEAGLLKPYNYAKGYARLQTYMDNHMNTSSRQRILKPLSTFRPGFRAIAKTLKDIDLILVEEAFERMLLDYDRVFTSMAIPACLWRRTGEIYRGNKEFALLVEVSIDDLKNGKLTIYELMSEESSVNFWEKYGSIAFDKTQKAVLTSCNLKSKDGRKKKNCCFSFTIRRDRYNIPSCIVGNFIPISN